MRRSRARSCRYIPVKDPEGLTALLLIMNLYDNNGYLNFSRISSIPANFVFIVGGRGTGKTYGALKYVWENKIKFMFSRRQRQEYDTISKNEASPFKSLNADLNINVNVRSINHNLSGFYDGESGLPIGYLTALVNISTLRGLDFSDCDWWIYDEFIPEPHVRPIKEEGQAVLNAYETFNRNRELQGRPPLKLIGLSNSNMLACPLFIELDLVNVVERLKKSGDNFWMDKARGVAVIYPWDSPLSEEKMETALYKLVNKESEFYQMAIENRFRDLDESAPVSRNLREYTPVLRIGEISIYKPKNAQGKYYCTTHASGSCPEYGISEIQIDRCIKKYSWIPNLYLSNRIEFESYICEALFNKYLFA